MYPGFVSWNSWKKQGKTLWLLVDAPIRTQSGLPHPTPVIMPQPHSCLSRFFRYFSAALKIVKTKFFSFLITDSQQRLILGQVTELSPHQFYSCRGSVHCCHQHETAAPSPQAVVCSLISVCTQSLTPGNHESALHCCNFVIPRVLYK